MPDPVAASQPRDHSAEAAYPAAVFCGALALRGISLALFFRTPYALYPVLDARRFYEWALEILTGAAAPGPFLYEPLYAYLQAAIYALTGIDFHHVLLFQAVAGSLGAVLAYFILLDHLPPRWSLAGALAYAAYPVTLLADTLPIKEPIATLLLLAAIFLLQRHLRTGRIQTLFLAGLVFGLVLLVRENLLALAPFLFLCLLAAGGGIAVAVRRSGVLLLGAALAVLPVTARNCLVGGDCVLVAASGGSNLFMAFNERSRGDSFVQPAFARSGPARLTEDSIAEAARRAGRFVTASEASRFWSRAALRYVIDHPGRSLGLLAQRLWVSLGNDEISGNYPHEYFSRINPLVGFNPLGFGLILAFGSVGWWCVRGDRATLIFPAVFLGTWVSFLPFWTLDRFRLPAVLPLIAGSLFAIREIVRRLGRRDIRGSGALFLAVLLVLAVSLPPRLDAQRRAEIVGLAYARGADLYLQQGDLPRAGAYLDRARRGPRELPEISLVAARYFAAAGRPEDALRELAVFRAWRRDFEDAELLQARLLAARGERTAARGILEEYLAAWPGSARAAQALEQLGADTALKANPSSWRGASRGINTDLSSIKEECAMAANQQPQQTGSDTQNKAILIGSGFIAGLVVGVIIMNFTGTSGGSGVSTAPAPITGGQMQQQGPDRVKLSRDIAQLEDIVKKDPNNYQALVQIGNDYFDLGEAQKAIDFYSKALAIKGDDPNVLTDLGVMYRQVKDFPKAVAAFRKAAAVSPTHPQSRMNLGVVLMHDLNDAKGAIAAWEDFLRVAPNDPNAESIRRSMEELRAQAAGGTELDKAARELGQQANPPAKQ